MTDEHSPFLESDQLPAYTTALLHTYGEWYQPERNGDRGRYEARCRKPRPGLLYAQVVKRRAKGRVVADISVYDHYISKARHHPALSGQYVQTRLGVYHGRVRMSTPVGR